MKHPSKKLLNDLIEDSASVDYRAEVLSQTLRSARHRKHLRRFCSSLGAAALAGLLVLTFGKAARSRIPQKQGSPQYVAAPSEPRLPPPQTASAAADPNLAVVQTTEFARPKEISDQELMTSLSRHEVGLIRFGSGDAVLIH